jgi:hypothetical protein
MLDLQFTQLGFLGLTLTKLTNMDELLQNNEEDSILQTGFYLTRPKIDWDKKLYGCPSYPDISAPPEEAPE